jgi:hypothetical protein
MANWIVSNNCRNSALKLSLSTDIKPTKWKESQLAPFIDFSGKRTTTLTKELHGKLISILVMWIPMEPTNCD